jgi:hypothetical protein
MDIIHPQVDARVLKRVSSKRKPWIANVREQHGKAPREDENVQTRMMSDKVAQQVAERPRALARIVFEELRPRVQIPSKQCE